MTTRRYLLRNDDTKQWLVCYNDEGAFYSSASLHARTVTYRDALRLASRFQLTMIPE